LIASSSSASSRARPPDAGDRRQVILELTAKGRSLQVQVRGIEEAMYAGLDGIGSAAELATVIAVLERVVAGRASGDAIAARVARRCMETTNS